jgi:hypothetical protein
VRPVGAAIVREHSLYGDAAISKPLDGAVQDAGGGGGGLVVVDLGVGDAGVVVDDCVYEGVAHLWAVPPVPSVCSASRHGFSGLGPSDVAPPAAVGNVSNLLHVHMHRGRGDPESRSELNWSFPGAFAG